MNEKPKQKVPLTREDMVVGGLYKNWCGEVRKLIYILDDYFNPYVMSEYIKGHVNGKENGEITAGRCFDLYDLNECNYQKFESKI